MSKESAEVLVCRNANVTIANDVRNQLIDRFPGLWFYVHQNGDIYAANGFAGRLSVKEIEEVSFYASRLKD